MSTKYFLPIFSMLLLIAASGSLKTIHPQEPESAISGFVKNKITGQVLPSVSILIFKDSLGVNGPPEKGTSTDHRGFYSISKLHRLSFFLIARIIGYKQFRQQVNIPPGRNTTINIEMIQQDIRLQEVIVKAELSSNVNISSVEITPKFLNRMPSLSGEIDLFKSLQLLPGITSNNEISSGLYVRGGSPDQTLTLIDGVVVYNPAHLGNFATTFNTDALKSVKLIKGAFPAEYGGRLSSVVDIKLRSGSNEKDSVVLGLGLINSRLSWEGPLNEKSTYMFSIRKMYYDFWGDILDKNKTSPRYNFFDMNTKLTFSAGISDNFSLSAFFSGDNIYSPDNSSIEYDIQWNNSAISLNWANMLPESRISNMTLSYVNYKFKSILNDTTGKASASDFFSSSGLQDIILKKDYELDLAENNRSKFGFDLTFHNYKLSFSNVYSPLLETASGNDKSLTSFEGAAFFQSEWQILGFLKLNPGLRFYYLNERKNIQLEPRLSVIYNLTDDIAFKAAYAKAHQFFHLIIKNDISLPTDLWYPSSGTIEPSGSEQYVLAYDQSFYEKQFNFSIEAYYKSMQNLYEFKDNPIYNPQNSIIDLFTKGSGEAYGVELFLNKSSGVISGWLGYTLSWTKRKFDELNRGQLFYPRFDRRHDISLVLAYRFSDNLKFGLTWTYATGQGFTMPAGQYQIGGVDADPANRIQFDYTERNAYKLPDYHKMDITASYEFNWGEYRMEAYVNINNVYNRKNPFAYYASIDKSPAASGVIPLPQFHSISLFPFIPSIGINIRF